MHSSIKTFHDVCFEWDGISSDTSRLFLLAAWKSAHLTFAQVYLCVIISNVNNSFEIDINQAQSSFTCLENCFVQS